MQKYFFIRLDGRYHKIIFNEIIFVEGARNYLKIVTDKRNYLVLMSMKKMEHLLPAHLFKRIHKSYIVSLDAITAFESDRAFLKDKELPIGACYSNVLHQSFTLVKDDEIKTPVFTLYAYNSAGLQYRN